MWPLENTASLCRTLTPFLISVSNNMLTFQRRSKCSSADQQQGWYEESLIVTSPWTRRQRERGSVISGERKALTRLGSRGQRLHMELTSCQVVLSWPDYETADVYTHWDRLASNLWRMWGCLSWSRSCCFSFCTFSVSMQMIRSSFWLFCVCLSSLCGSLLPRCVSMSSFFSVFVAVLKICGTFLCLWGCVLGICGLVASLFSHFWRAEVVYECLWLISRYSRRLLLHCVSFPVCLCRCVTNPWVISVFVLLFCM